LGLSSPNPTTVVPRLRESKSLTDSIFFLFVSF
jgi:hypothetical protein